MQVDDDYSSNEGYKEDAIERADAIDIGGFLDINDNGPFSYDGVNIYEEERSSTPMKRALFWLWDTMVETTSQCKESINVQLCDHAISCLQIVALEIQTLDLTQTNELLHPGIVFNSMENGLGNSINHLKGWHETLLQHANSHKKRIWE